MNLPHIIATGEAGHGKDTIGAYLVAQHGYVRAAFADPLKQEVIDSYGSSPIQDTRELMYDPIRKQEPFAGLALKFCSDPDFVAVALREFAMEDERLFKVMNLAYDKAPDALDDATLDAAIAEVGQGTIHSEVAKEIKASMKALDATLSTDEGRIPFGVQGAEGGHEAPTNFTEGQRMYLPRSPRRLCQLWGTEYRRAQSDTYWVDKAADFIAKSKSPVVICDGRFPNECDWANEQGLRRMHAVTPGKTLFGTKHASEQIPPPDERTAVLINDRRDDNFVSFNKKIEDALADFVLDQKKQSRVKLAA